MKTKYILGAALVLGTLSLCTSCDNYFDEKYLDNANPQISVVKTYDYTLVSSDYKTIAANKANKAYAAELDSLGGTDINSTALAEVGNAGCFNDIASADMYIPAFIYNKYPQLDSGSIFNVTYLTDEGQPIYLEYYNLTIQYTLTAANYKSVYGNNDTPYLTAANEAMLTNFLPQVDDDYLVGVKYDFAETVGAPVVTKEVLYIYKDGYVWQPYTEPYVLLVPADIYGQEEKFLSNTYPYAKEEDQVVLMEYDSKTQLYVATEYNFTGGAWTPNSGRVEETLSFMLGNTWAANLSTYYQQAIAGDGNMGKITIQDFNLEDGITYIWNFDNLYGMKGTAYKSGPHYGEGWFVTPKIKLKNSKEPALSFDMAMNYGPDPADGRYEQASVWVSTDYAGDVTTATWTQLPWNTFDGQTGFPDANSWTFYNSGRLDLSPWNNQTIYIGFRYKSEPGQTCSTWEVKNILVNEPEE